MRTLLGGQLVRLGEGVSLRETTRGNEKKEERGNGTL